MKKQKNLKTPNRTKQKTTKLKSKKATRVLLNQS